MPPTLPAVRCATPAHLSRIFQRCFAAGPVLPAGSVASTWNRCFPGFRCLNFAGEEHASNGLESSLHSKLEPGSFAANLNFAFDFVVLAAGPLAISTVGATVSGVAGGFVSTGGF